jgi:hypothetical protein
MNPIRLDTRHELTRQAIPQIDPITTRQQLIMDGIPGEAQYLVLWIETVQLDPHLQSVKRVRMRYFSVPDDGRLISRSSS